MNNNESKKPIPTNLFESQMKNAKSGWQVTVIKKDKIETGNKN